MIPDSIRQGLVSVGRRGDRTSPLAFVGRDAALSLLQDVVDESKVSGPFAGAVRILQDAPGMGKTAVRDEFLRKTLRDQSKAVATADEREMRPAVAERKPASGPFAPDDAGETADPPSFVTCVRISADELASTPLELVDTIDRELRQPDPALLNNRYLRAIASGVVRRVTRGGDAQDLLTGGALGLSASSSMKKCLNAYAQHVWKRGTVIVLLIDEAQQCDVDDKRTKNNLRAIYNADHQARMPMLFFGLPDTGATLQKLGLSRLTDAAAKPLGLLLGQEGRKVLDGAFEKLGLCDPVSPAWSEHLKGKGTTEGQWRKWRDRLIGCLNEASQNFPQHLAVGLSAACKGLLRTQDDGVNFNDRLHQDIVADHAQRMTEYYKGRLASAEGETHALAFGAICELFDRRKGADVRRNEALRLMLDEWRFRPGADPNADLSPAVKLAVAKGVFGARDMAGDGALTPPPIPSMQRHLQQRFEAALAERRPEALALSKTVDALAPPAPDKRKAPAPRAP